jgi:hypothetical protein
MKRNDFTEHMIVENVYLKYKCNNLIYKNEKLKNDIVLLNNKLNSIYRNHANSILLLQEKINTLKISVEERNKYIHEIINRRTFSMSYPNSDSTSETQESEFSIDSNITLDSTITHS